MGKPRGVAGNMSKDATHDQSSDFADGWTPYKRTAERMAAKRVMGVKGKNKLSRKGSQQHLSVSQDDLSGQSTKNSKRDITATDTLPGRSRIGSKKGLHKDLSTVGSLAGRSKKSPKKDVSSVDSLSGSSNKRLRKHLSMVDSLSGGSKNSPRKDESDIHTCSSGSRKSSRTDGSIGESLSYRSKDDSRKEESISDSLGHDTKENYPEQQDNLSDSANTLNNASHDEDDMLEDSSEEVSPSVVKAPVKECTICNSVLLEHDYKVHMAECLRRKFSRIKKTAGNDLEAAGLSREVKETAEEELTESASELSSCNVCHRNLLHLNSIRRGQHLNRCMDRLESEKKEQAAQTAALHKARDKILDCPLCGQVLKTAHSRKSHLKRCAKLFGVCTTVLIERVKQQEAEYQLQLQAGVLPDTNRASAPPRAKKKATPQTGSRVGRLEEPWTKFDEDTQLAIALSTSIKGPSCGNDDVTHYPGDMETGSAIGGPEVTKKDAFSLMMTPNLQVNEGKKRKRKKGKETVTAIVAPDDEGYKRRLADRIAGLLLPRTEEGEVAATPPFKKSLAREALKTSAREAGDSAPTGLSWWSKCGMEGIEAEDHTGAYYVATLMPPIAVCCVAAGSKLKNMASIPGWWGAEGRQGHPDKAETPIAANRTMSLMASTQTAVLLADLATNGGADVTQYPGDVTQSFCTPDECKSEASGTRDVSVRTLSCCSSQGAPKIPNALMSGSLYRQLSVDGTPVGTPASVSAPNTATGFCVSVQAELQSEKARVGLLASLDAMVNNSTFSDVTLAAAGGHVLHGHRCILANRCPCLMKLMPGEGGEVDLSAHSEETVLCLLRYLYSADVTIPHHSAHHVQALAKRLELPELEEICDTLIVANDIEIPTDDDPGHEIQNQSILHETVDRELQDLVRDVWSSEEEEEAMDSEPDKEHSGSVHGDAACERRDSDGGGAATRDAPEIEELYEFMATQKCRERRDGVTECSASSDGDLSCDQINCDPGSESPGDGIQEGSAMRVSAGGGGGAWDAARSLTDAELNEALVAKLEESFVVEEEKRSAQTTTTRTPGPAPPRPGRREGGHTARTDEGQKARRNHDAADSELDEDELLSYLSDDSSKPEVDAVDRVTATDSDVTRHIKHSSASRGVVASLRRHANLNSTLRTSAPVDGAATPDLFNDTLPELRLTPAETPGTDHVTPAKSSACYHGSNDFIFRLPACTSGAPRSGKPADRGDKVTSKEAPLTSLPNDGRVPDDDDAVVLIDAVSDTDSEAENRCSHSNGGDQTAKVKAVQNDVSAHATNQLGRDEEETNLSVRSDDADLFDSFASQTSRDCHGDAGAVTNDTDHDPAVINLTVDSDASLDDVAASAESRDAHDNVLSGSVSFQAGGPDFYRRISPRSSPTHPAHALPDSPASPVFTSQRSFRGNNCGERRSPTARAEPVCPEPPTRGNVCGSADYRKRKRIPENDDSALLTKRGRCVSSDADQSDDSLHLEACDIERERNVASESSQAGCSLEGPDVVDLTMEKGGGDSDPEGPRVPDSNGSHDDWPGEADPPAWSPRRPTPEHTNTLGYDVDDVWEDFSDVGICDDNFGLPPSQNAPLDELPDLTHDDRVPMATTQTGAVARACDEVPSQRLHKPVKKFMFKVRDNGYKGPSDVAHERSPKTSLSASGHDRVDPHGDDDSAELSDHHIAPLSPPLDVGHHDILPPLPGAASEAMSSPHVTSPVAMTPGADDILMYDPPTDMESDISGVLQVPDDCHDNDQPTNSQKRRRGKTSLVARAMQRAKALVPPSPFTPMPEYDTMATPVLKKTCQKYGLRAQPKKRMVKLLQEVYKETHKYETDSELDQSVLDEVRRDHPATQHESQTPVVTATDVPKKKGRGKKGKSAGTGTCSKSRATGKGKQDAKVKAAAVSSAAVTASVEHVTSGDEATDTSFTSSQGSSMTDVPEESMLIGEDDSKAPGGRKDLAAKRQMIWDYITKDDDLYTRVLYYEPLDLDALLRDLKEKSDCNIGMNILREFLDEQNVQFTTKNLGKTRGSRRNKKDPKKVKGQRRKKAGETGPS